MGRTKRHPVVGGGDARTSRRLKRGALSIEWQDVDRQDQELIASQPCRLTRLPLVRDCVFEFLAPVQSLDQRTVVRDGINVARYRNQLAPLRSICQQWYKLTHVLVADCQKRAPVIDFKTGDVRELKNILRVAKQDGADAQQLTISMGALMYHPWWETLFQSFPNVVRLDLVRVVAPCTSIVLDAAAKFCPRVQALALPYGPSFRYQMKDQDASLMTADLTNALRAWRTSNGGLRFLTIPYWVIGDKDYAVFMAAVAQSCPRIEWLRCENSEDDSTLVFGYGQAPPSLPVDVWTTFCQQCLPTLREFSWKIVPFTGPHTRAFNAQPKLQLEELSITAKSPSWWHDVRDLSPLVAMVATAPKLRVISFMLRDFSVHHSMRPDALDTLAKQIVSKCPEIEVLHLMDPTFDLRFLVQGDTIDALIRSASLRDLRVDSALITDASITAMLRAFSSRHRHQGAKISVQLYVDGFVHNAMLEALWFLEREPANCLATVELELMVNGSGRVSMETGQRRLPDPRYQLESRQSIDELVERIKRRHESTLSYVRVTVTPYESNGATVLVIEDLELMFNVHRERLHELYQDIGGGAEHDGSRGGVFDEPEERYVFD